MEKYKQAITFYNKQQSNLGKTIALYETNKGKLGHSGIFEINVADFFKNETAPKFQNIPCDMIVVSWI